MKSIVVHDEQKHERDAAYWLAKGWQPPDTLPKDNSMFVKKFFKKDDGGYELLCWWPENIFKKVT